MRSRSARALVVCALLSLVSSFPSADTTTQTLPFSQDWSNTGLITTDDSWAGVPGVIGYRGDGLTGGTAVDPQTVVAEGHRRRRRIPPRESSRRAPRVGNGARAAPGGHGQHVGPVEHPRRLQPA